MLSPSNPPTFLIIKLPSRAIDASTFVPPDFALIRETNSPVVVGATLDIIFSPLILRRRVESNFVGSIVMTLRAVAVTLVVPLIEFAHVATSVADRVSPPASSSAPKDVPFSVKSPLSIRLIGVSELFFCLGRPKESNDSFADAPKVKLVSKYAALPVLLTYSARYAAPASIVFELARLVLKVASSSVPAR